MADHVIEPATSGRATCRGCGRKIAKGELRFGERLPNPYADEGDLTLWFHPRCGAFRRPASFLAVLDTTDADLSNRDGLAADARSGIAEDRLTRIAGAERAASGRASCRSCREKIAKDAWRIRLVFFEEGRFEPSGFVHAGCAGDYFGTADVLERLVHFGGLDEDSTAEVRDALA